MQQRTMENVPNISRIMCTPYTPRFQERQRFDLSTRPEEEAEEIDISGLEGMLTHLLYLPCENVRLLFVCIAIV